MASSRVGSRISASAPRVFSAWSFSTIGIRKESVLPVPVCAVASTSLPSSAGGIAPDCTGVGVVKLQLCKRCFRESEIAKSVNKGVSDIWNEILRTHSGGPCAHFLRGFGGPQAGACFKAFPHDGEGEN